jgi:prepilin-type N-terminal cleavage/methylation domain-containing protein
MKSGFTLMEVLIAMAVLSIGIAGIGHSISGFLQIKEREAKKGRALIEAVSLMEEQVASPHSCIDPKAPNEAESIARRGIDFSLTFERVPGGAPLQWAVIRETSGYWSDLNLKRIVKCVETASP